MGDRVGDALGAGATEGVAVGSAVTLGDGVGVTDVTGAQALATITATINSLTELP